MAVDISGLSYFMPLYSAIFVFVLLYAILLKTKLLGDNKAINFIISIIIAIIFSTVSSAGDYINSVTPWFAVVFVVLFLILLLIGLGTGKLEMTKPWFIWVFVIVLVLVFLGSLSGISTFFSNFWNNITEFVNTQARIAGTIIFVVIVALVAWVIVKK